jgi:hypothetical protein
MSSIIRITTVLLLCLEGFSRVSAQGQFSGVFYGDYFYNIARDTSTARTNLPSSALTGPQSLQGFIVRRVYFTYDYDIAEKFATRFRLELDMTPNASGAYAIVENKNLSVFVKDAWLRWKSIFKGSDLYFGISPTAAYELSEREWSFRSLEKTIMDLRGITAARHVGVDLRGNLDEEGTFGYWVTVANVDNGQKPKDLTPRLENGDKYNLYSAHFSAKPSKEFVFTLYGDFRPTYPVNDPASTTSPKSTVSHNTLTSALFVGYRAKTDYAIGVEGFMQHTANDYADPADMNSLKPLDKIGISLWAWYNFADDLGAVARYDYYDPKTGSNNVEKGNSRQYILAGLAYRPAKNVQVIPNLQIETYESIPNGRSIGTAVTGRVTLAASF